MPLRGRHRRYRPSRVSQASLTVTAGGAGLALPLISVSGASAASLDTWDKVAQCESTQDWSVNTGNGYYGGLQFAASTWKAYGGTVYASRADLATKSQQIAVAEKVLRGQGPQAWPVCGPKAGLTRGGAAPRQDPAPSHATKTVPANAQKAQRTPTTPVRVATKAAPAKAAPAAKSSSPTTPGRTTADAYVVVSGDTLSGIAADHRTRGGWPQLYAANRQTVGADPDLILPGQRLRLTGTERPAASTQAPVVKPQPREKAAPAKPVVVHKTVQKPAQKPAGTVHHPAPSGSSFMAPVSGVSPSTAYRASGASWSSGYHTGVDFPVSTGTSVKAVGNGTIVSAGWGGAYGYQVVIRHPDGRYSQYGHLSQLSVRAGQPVNRGQQIGRSGSTGNATGPHLHFEIRTGPGYGSDINPLTYLRAHGVSI